MEQCPVTVVVITFNEEYDLAECLLNISGWATKIIVVDSFSQDHTLEIASKYGCEIYQHAWESFAKQREWAINHSQIDTDWVFFVDADERLTKEIKTEIQGFLSFNPKQEGCYIRRKFYFMGRWLHYGGYYPCSEIRLFRKDKVRFVDEGGGARERFLIDGEIGSLRSNMIHIYDKSLGEWILKHNRLARLEAESDFITRTQAGSKGLGIKVWVRLEIWKRLPRGIRPFFLFFYRYVIRLGFLDGKVGFYYCFLHDFWYPMLVDLNFLELSYKEK